jgi:hypothetical protein
MEKQLQLLEPPKDWRLEPEVREIGLRGISAAREALEQAHRDARSEPGRRAA